MKQLHTAMFLVLTALLCLSGERALADVFASNVRVTQPGSDAPFDLRFSDSSGALIRFTLSDHADSVLVKIKSGATVLRTIKATNYSFGDTSVVWNGKSDAGVAVTNGTYSIQITTYDIGHSGYTEIFYAATAGLSTRGVTTITNPALKNFGFIYSVDDGGFQGATGVVRFASTEEPWGNKKDSAQVTSTGLALGATANGRFGPQADTAGYVYVAGNTSKIIYRFHTDSLNVTMVDSGYGSWFPSTAATMIRSNGTRVGVVVLSSSGNSTASKNSAILGFHLNPGQSLFGGAKDTLVAGVSASGADTVLFWDLTFGRDSVLYATFNPTSPFTKFHPGVAKFNLAGKTWPLHMSDTVWTARLDSGLAGTIAFHPGAASDGSQDVVYMVEARLGSGNPPGHVLGVYALSGLNNAHPTRAFAYADPTAPEGNNTVTRTGVASDAVGNIIYFENSDEEMALISPPTGSNHYTYNSFATVRILESQSIGSVRIDANNDGKPDLLNDTVSVVGTINGVNLTASANRFQYTIQDGTGGIVITKGSETGGGKVFYPGDRVSVTGKVDFFNGVDEIDVANVATDVAFIDSSALVAIPLTMDQLMANPELYESRYISLNPVAKTAASAAWPASGSNANMTVTDGYDTLTLFIDLDTDIDGTTEPAYPISMKGVLSQFTSVAPYNSGYEIEPEYFADITGGVSTPPNPHFALVTPANNSTIKLDSNAQSVKFTWKKAVDLNGDNLIYQWQPVGGTAVTTTSSGADTFLVRTGAQLATFLAGKDTAVLHWTVKTKDPSNPIVSNFATDSVKLVRGAITGVRAEDALPTEFALDQNYPNPFNPSTSIKFALPKDANVVLKVYDVLGREVRTLVNNDMKVGYHEVVWDGKNGNGLQVASGMYLYRITAEHFVSTKKMMMLK